MSDNRFQVGALPIEALAEAQREFLLKVYAWMVGGLMITGLTALFTASSAVLMETIWTNTLLRWVVILAPLGMVFAMSGMMHRLSPATASLLFLVYSALVGLMMSVIFIIYEPASIVTTFFVTAGTFAAMSVYGWITKRDLSSMGSFLTMGLIGLIIAMVANFLLESPALYFAISIIGVLIFTGLTAYDTQRLKEDYVVGSEATAEGRKAAIVGALTLYLDFINLFLFLLRLLGNRN